MDFTEPYRYSNWLTLYSPNSKFLASYHLAQEGFTRLHPSAPIQPQEDGIMRVVEIHLFRDSFPTVSEIGWSPDSTLLLAACPTTSTVLVFSAEDEDFKATITVLGISNRNVAMSGSGSRSAATSAKVTNGQKQVAN
ncbi:hypothetical protein BG011_004677 [Mortierella polycephala]|uniref:Uncharacterized protein n=1 Tax=Mortierella polycephala TaxID=41804 RepID=A0A9P6QGJ5_9FUNG|nr:hypothetical protein BG011_004677 [Mortierella polycephala]